MTNPRSITASTNASKRSRRRHPPVTPPHPPQPASRTLSPGNRCNNLHMAAHHEQTPDVTAPEWDTETCPRCGDNLETTNPAFQAIARELHSLGRCDEPPHPARDQLPALPPDTHTVRLYDHHGQLIETITPAEYERLRPAANARRHQHNH